MPAKQKTPRAIRGVDATGLIAPLSHICLKANHLAPEGRLVWASTHSECQGRVAPLQVKFKSMERTWNMIAPSGWT
jgi:hypothetical protein